MTAPLNMAPFNDADRWTLANLAETFQNTGSDAVKAYDGQRFTLLGRTPDDQYDRIEPEAGSMWRIRFADGFEANVWGDEIAREEV